MTLQAALEDWERQMPARRDGRELRDVDEILRARCTFLRELLRQGWQVPVRVQIGLLRDELLLQEVHGWSER